MRRLAWLTEASENAEILTSDPFSGQELTKSLQLTKVEHSAASANSLKPFQREVSFPVLTNTDGVDARIQRHRSLLALSPRISLRVDVGRAQERRSNSATGWSTASGWG